MSILEPDFRAQAAPAPRAAPAVQHAPVIETADEALQPLIRRATAGDHEAFNLLVLQFQDRVFTTAYRLLGDRAQAADAAQEAFINAYQRLNTYKGGSFRAWLLRITANLCYDELRRQKRRPQTALEIEDDEGEETERPLPAPDPSPEQAVIGRQLQRAIQQCIDALHPDQRVVLVMSDMDEFDYAEIAGQLNVPAGTVKSRLSRARANVRECLQGARELLPPAFRLIREDN